ncbi:hypothetical protein ACOCG7_24855 [Paraburkholderia sp. DD10]|jgi:hypothetical protein|uniref:hypothetical protein n=1 Tax=Paraburkholderia TaxID=1822464 RepID=UPI003A02F0CD
MNIKQLEADIDKIHAETMRTFERNKSPWGFLRDFGAFIAGAVTFAGMVAVLSVLYVHLHPH